MWTFAPRRGNCFGDISSNGIRIATRAPSLLPQRSTPTDREVHDGPSQTTVAARTRAFVEEHVLPVEDEFDGDVEAAGGERLRVELQAQGPGRRRLRPARAGRAAAASAWGWPTARRCSRRPDGRCSGRWRSTSTRPTRATSTCSTQVAVGHQRERFLGPLARGEQRSAFAMTEPAPGAGVGPHAP